MATLKDLALTRVRLPVVIAVAFLTRDEKICTETFLGHLSSNPFGFPAFLMLLYDPKNVGYQCSDGLLLLLYNVGVVHHCNDHSQTLTDKTFFLVPYIMSIIMALVEF